MDIALLDLNYTLVENSTEKHSPFTVQIERERYRRIHALMTPKLPTQLPALPCCSPSPDG